MKEKNKYMKLAINLAKKNVEENNGGPFGAVVVKDGKIISKGRNHVVKSNDPTAHAEIVAIREACTKLKTYDLSDCELYASCEPCPMCLGSIYWARISKLYYAASKEDAARSNFIDADIYKELSKPIEERKLISTQLMREDAIKVLDKWIQSDSKIAY